MLNVGFVGVGWVNLVKVRCKFCSSRSVGLAFWSARDDLGGGVGNGVRLVCVGGVILEVCVDDL